MKIAALQMDIRWEDPEANLRSARRLAQEAADAGARLVALPEMFATGFSMRAPEMAAHAGGVRDFLAGLARELGVWILAGVVEPGPAASDATAVRPRNAALVFDPAGRAAGRYDKIHPFSLGDEHRHYGAGDALLTVDIEGVAVTPFVCYDLRFPEIFRAAAARTALFVVIANWPTKRRAAWSALLRARAIENLAWVLGVNRVGAGGGLEYSGDSALFDPLGEPLAEAGAAVGALLGDIDPGRVAELRTSLGFLVDRRPELYPRLEAGGAAE